jgi:AcrR family transcriptional regulator
LNYPILNFLFFSITYPISSWQSCKAQDSYSIRLTYPQSVEKMNSKRVTKDPEERKCELIEAAERLFVSKGYKETAISDIVRAVKVSQGAFYYYFQSKEDVLVAVLKKNMLLMEHDVSIIAKRDDLDEAEKLNLIFNRFIDVAVSGKQIFAYIHQHKSATLHQKLMADSPFARVAPMVAEVIARGKENGRFQAEYPLETATLLFVFLGSSLHTFHKMEANSGSKNEEDPDRVSPVRLRLTLEDMLAKALGAKDYKFVLRI